MIQALLVDSDENARLKTREALMFGGIQTDTAATGAQAMSMNAAKRYDCIVMDAVFPDIDGERLCEALRQTTRVPMLFISAARDLELNLRMLKAGCDGTMQKPCNAKLLTTWVSLKAERHREAVAARSRDAPEK